MKALLLNNHEAVVLAMLAMTGATAFDTPIGAQIAERFAKKFGTKITNDDVVAVLDKVKSLVTVSGDEDVAVGG